MNLYQLRYFSLLAKTGHFRKTAEQLCITQPRPESFYLLIRTRIRGALYLKNRDGVLYSLRKDLKFFEICRKNHWTFLMKGF